MSVSQSSVLIGDDLPLIEKPLKRGPFLYISHGQDYFMRRVHTEALSSGRKCVQPALSYYNLAGK
jgi:hypothetical protein